jgi:hypothetical protein
MIQPLKSAAVRCNTLEISSIQDSKEDEINLSDLQKKDVEISKVRNWLEQRLRPEPLEFSFGGPMLKSLWSQRALLEVKDDQLCRKWTDKKGSTLQAIVLFSERRCVLNYSHDHKTAGHLGVTKALCRIRQSFYWPGLQRDVRRYVAGCEVCMKSKSSSHNLRGPFAVEAKLSDLTYKVNSCSRGSSQVIHVDRMRLKRRQELAQENIDDEESSKEVVPERIDECDSKDGYTENENEHTDRSMNRQSFIPERRVRKIPKWLSEYETY